MTEGCGMQNLMLKMTTQDLYSFVGASLAQKTTVRSLCGKITEQRMKGGHALRCKHLNWKLKIHKLPCIYLQLTENLHIQFFWSCMFIFYYVFCLLKNTCFRRFSALRKNVSKRVWVTVDGRVRRGWVGIHRTVCNLLGCQALMTLSAKMILLS